MSKRLILIVLAVVALAAAGLAVFLPQIISQAVAQGMKGLLHSNQVTARVEKSPSFLMLAGQFDSVDLTAKDAKPDKLTFSNMEARLTGVQLDVSELITGRKVVIRSVRDASVTASVTQEELEHYLNQTVKGVRNAQVNIETGKVRVSGTFTLGQIAKMTVTLEGRVVSDGQKIKLVTEKILLNNAQVGNLAGTLLAEIPLVEVKMLPFGVTVRDIVMDQGRILIYADNKAR